MPLWTRYHVAVKCSKTNDKLIWDKASPKVSLACTGIIAAYVLLKSARRKRPLARLSEVHPFVKKLKIHIYSSLNSTIFLLYFKRTMQNQNQVFLIWGFVYVTHTFKYLSYASKWCLFVQSMRAFQCLFPCYGRWK